MPFRSRWGAVVVVLLLLAMPGSAGAQEPPPATPVTSPSAGAPSPGSASPLPAGATSPGHGSPSPAPSQGSPSPAVSPSPSPVSSPSPSPELQFDLPALVLSPRGDSWWDEPVLFEVADSGKISGKDRARRVLDRVKEVAALEELNPEVAVDQTLGMTVVRADDKILITVLPEDLPDYFQRMPPDKVKMAERQLAERWREALERDIHSRITARTGEFRWGSAILMAILLVLAILANAFVTWFARRFLSTPAWSFKAFIWLVWLAMCLALVPELHGLQNLLHYGLLSPLWLFMTAGLVSGFVFQAGRAMLRRYFRSLAELQEERQALHQHRLDSLEGAALFAFRLLVGLAAVLYVLVGMDISPGQVLAGAGLLGAALTLVFQDLLRDLIAGANILAEEQFVVGDWIQSGAVEGTVEAFQLRATRVRATDGTVSLVPNSELRVVKNHSQGWSQVDYRVTVEMGADAEEALRMVAEEAAALASERPDQVMEAPTVLGLGDLGPDGITLRLLVKTRPLQQWSVRRELNRRVLRRLRKEGIGLARQRYSVTLEGESTSASRGRKPGGGATA